MILLTAALAPAPDESVPELPNTRHVATRMAGAARQDAVSADTDATARRMHVVASWARNPRFVFASLAGSAFTLSASVEIGGAQYRLKFGGVENVEVAANGSATSDPLPVTIRPDTKIFTRTHTVRSSSWSGTWQGNIPPLIDEGESLASGDLTTPGVLWVPDKEAGNSRGPLAMIAEAESSQRALAFVGDSIAAFGSSWAVRVAELSGIAWQGAAVGGQAISHIQSDRARRFGPDGLTPFTHHLCQYGANDAGGSDPGTFPWASYIDYWTWAAGQGVKVIQATQLPHSSSTDGWTTTGNQTRISWPKREAFNLWLRDGAPIIDGAKVAPGTAPALRVGDSGHPLFAVFDAGAAVESSIGSGLWRTDKGSIAGDGLHPSNLGGDVIAAAFPMALLD